MMEATCSSEIWVDFQQTAGLCILEDGTLQKKCISKYVSLIIGGVSMGVSNKKQMSIKYFRRKIWREQKFGRG
jgi:hypothetical protein